MLLRAAASCLLLLAPPLLALESWPGDTLATSASAAVAFAGISRPDCRRGLRSVAPTTTASPRRRRHVEATSPPAVEIRASPPSGAEAVPSPPVVPRVDPRSGLAQRLLDAALASPLWKHVLVPQARRSISKTAEDNGIPWNAALRWIRDQDGPWRRGDGDGFGGPHGDASYPEYYTKPFHAYDEGNLSWDAAFEQELAGRAVGARNFPAYGEAGEEAFRSVFDTALESLGAAVPRGGTVVDLGCGPGTSTRRIASRFPDAKKIVGVDLSPYFIAVGRKLLELAPKGHREGGPWVTSIQSDERIELRVGDATSTGLPDRCADVVNVGLVMHELPTAISKDVCDEARRLLKPGGQLWVYEMDFDSPAFASQRSNPLLFSLIRATEPYLDEYADGCAEIRAHVAEIFDDVRITAATGRHYALVANKGKGGRTITDTRFNADGSYAIKDTHLKTWESKKEP